MSEEMNRTQNSETEGRIGRELLHEVIPCEASGEYVLPDYQPEIRKILAVNAALSPSGKYIGGDRAEFTGRVMHRILYTTEDGSPHAVTLATDYSFACPLPTENPAAVIADSMVESSVCRLGGPRKLTLRTRLRNMVSVTAEEEAAPEIRGMGSPEDAASLEILTGEIASTTLLTADTGEFSLTDTVRLENAAEGTRVVRSGGNLLVNECRVREDGCLLRGEAWVFALLADGGMPYTVRTKIPFEQLLPMDAVGAGAQATAYGRVNAVDATLALGEAGEAGYISFDVAAEAEATVALPLLCHPTLDLYSTAYEMDVTHRRITATRTLGTAMGNYTVSASRPKQECEAENALTVADTDGRIEISSVTAEHGRITVSGCVTAQLIFATACEDEGSAPLLAAEIPVPFRIETELRIGDEAHPRCACHAELIAVRGRIEQSALACDCEIALALRASAEEEYTVLASASPACEERLSTAGDRLIVAYPREDDTLFGIAARYHCSRAALAAANGIGEDALALSHLPCSLDGIHHLIIAKK